MNQSSEPIKKIINEVKTDNFFYRKVERIKPNWGAIENNPIFLSE